MLYVAKFPNRGHISQEICARIHTHPLTNFLKNIDGEQILEGGIRPATPGH